MNIVFFDPYYIKPDKIAELINILKIKEVYNLLPYNDFSEAISSFCGSALVIRRNANEALDTAKKRSVYKLVSHISTPIIAYGQWTGECSVADIYKDSNCRNFCANLELEHPNALILIHTRKHSEEISQSQIKIMPYFFNILKKYSKIDYPKRICCEYLSQYITLEYKKRSFVILFDGPFKAIAEHFWSKGFCDIAANFLTDEGIIERNKIIEEEKEEERQRWLERDNYDPDPWGAKAEMDYIRNNGGDWIDD